MVVFLEKKNTQTHPVETNNGPVSSKECEDGN